jgi:hypothetical protein
VVLVDEVSLCTLQDWQDVILPLVKLGCAVWCVGDMRSQLHAIGSQWHGQDKTEDYSEHPMVISALGKRLTLTEGHRCDARLFEFLSSMAYGWRVGLSLDALMEQCRAEFPSRGRPGDTNLCLCHVTRKRVITVAQRRKLRRDKPTAYLTLEGPPPMGQKLCVYPTVPLIVCLQTARQLLYNSQLLTVRSYDATHVVAEDAESGQVCTLTHDFVRSHCRSGHAYTISSCQGRQYSGSVALWDTKHARWSRRHAYTALSRARAYEALSIED